MQHRDEKQTIEMCYHKGENRDPCTNPPQWKLKNAEKGYRFKVCDAHLAWAIRLAGYPAIVDAYEPDSMRVATVHNENVNTVEFPFRKNTV